MKKFVIIFYFFYGNFLVSGVPLSQLIQTQTCPYNQNGYQDLNSLLQQALPQLYQQSSNNNLYPQQIMAQNDIIAQQPNIQINPKTNQLTQMYMDRILSSPTVQGVLDSSSRYYTPVLVETPNQTPKAVQNPGTVPQIVNNYFILPPEWLDLDEELPTSRNNDKRNADRNKQRNSNHQRRPSKDGTDNMANENGKRQPPNQNNGQTQRRGHARPQDNNQPERSQHQDHNSGRNNKRRPNDRQGNNDNRQMRERNGERRPNQRREHRNDNNQRPQRKERQNELNAKEEEKQANDDNNNNRESTGENEQNTRKRKKENKQQSDDDFIEGFRKQYPGIPDEAITGLLTYLKSSHLDQNFDYSQFYNHDLSYPLQFEHFVPPNRQQHQNNPMNRRPDRQPNNQRQRRPEPRTRPNQTLSPKPRPTESNETSPEPPTIEQNQPSETKSESKIETTTPTTEIIAQEKPQETKQENAIEAKPESKIETTTPVFISPELGSEDELPEVHNGLVDDYYPNFTNDHVYLDSEEVDIIRNHRDNRYHYTTDRNERNVKIIDDEIENVIMKPMNSEEIEIIEYRTPPLLESPDFRTKQIKKAKPKSNEQKFYDKYSNYSEAKFAKDVKNSKTDKNLKSEADVETVYAQSKVIKYGKNDDTEEEIDISVVTYYLPDNMQYEEDGKTVIVAKPIPADHFW